MRRGWRRGLGRTPPAAGPAVPPARLIRATGRAGVGYWPRPGGTPVRRTAPLGRTGRGGTSRLRRTWRLAGTGVRITGAGWYGWRGTVPTRPGRLRRGPLRAGVVIPDRGAARRSRPGVRRAAVITRIAHAASVFAPRGEAGPVRYFGRCGRCTLITLTVLLRAGILLGRPRASACLRCPLSAAGCAASGCVGLPTPGQPVQQVARVRRPRIGSHHTKAYHRAHIQSQGRRHPASVARH
jgi:hypothetical protein